MMSLFIEKNDDYCDGDGCGNQMTKCKSCKSQPLDLFDQTNSRTATIAIVNFGRSPAIKIASTATYFPVRP